jgi:hypothetical protein
VITPRESGGRATEVATLRQALRAALPSAREIRAA